MKPDFSFFVSVMMQLSDVNISSASYQRL